MVLDMNEIFISPTCEMIIFDNEDVITISFGGLSIKLPELNGAGE